MILRSIIKTETCLISDDMKTSEDVLKAIAEISSGNPALKSCPKDDVYNALQAREAVGSTGFGRGIAIPHCGLDAADDFVVGIIVSTKGIDFKSIDGKKSNIFFFIIGPASQRNRHIQILSAISRLIQSDAIVKSLLKVKTNEELLHIIEQNSDTAGEFHDQTPKVMFQVFIQKKNYFNEILQVFSEHVNGSVSVMETSSAGHYLYSLPLFSTFWSEESNQYSRIIQAVCDKNLANNIIRRINTIVPDINKQSGVLITVSELFYTNGSIDF
jgi:PTS system nitrogen regulatory IIA component